jgi:hypothetical protein
MGGGLMQLVAYGAQDIYLTGNPQITFFKVVYRRHTNFSMETIEQTINGTSTLTGSSTSGTVTISRNGDLVHKVYVTSSTASIENGMALISDVELEIGGQKIDKHYQEWNEIWAELTTPESKALPFKVMTGGIGTTGSTGNAGGLGVGMVQIPLNFWFCKNPGLALPLIALQYHEVKMKFNWGTSATTSVGVAAVCKVWCDYIYLDTDERRRFAQVSHEYLIEQLQREQKTPGSGNSKINFNHPVKELVWTSDQDYTDAKLTLNGHDRFAPQEEEYFQLRQPMDHHTAVPLNNLPCRDLFNMASSRHVLRSADATLPAAAADVEVEVRQPAGTILTDVKILCTQAAVVAAGDIGYRIGTASDGAEIVAAQTNEILDTGTAVALGAVTYPGMALSDPGALSADAAGGDLVKVAIDAAIRSGIVHDVQDEATHVIDVSYTATERTLYCRVQPTTNATAGKFCFIFGYEYINQADGAEAAHGSRTSQLTEKINVYSFALKPEEHQPSGTCNFSRIDTAHLNFTADPHTGTMNVYAVNYNVLRIMSGMGGLAYSN